MLTAGPRSHAARHKKAALPAITSHITTSALHYNHFSMSTPAVNISTLSFLTGNSFRQILPFEFPLSNNPKQIPILT